MTQKEAEVILKVNSKEAREKLEKLEAQAKDLRMQFADAFRKGDTRGIDNLNKQLQKVNKEINNMRTNAANIRAAMVRLNEASPRELQRTIKLINNELNSGRVKRGTKEWNDYVQKLKEVQTELSKVKKEMQPDSGRSILDKIKDGINDWGASAAAASAAFAGVVMSGKAAVQAYADMEAEEANVRKFTGMTAEQVATLNAEFKKMDTRTSREELNKLAQEAGRLGKTSQEDVLGFVRAADQINVALDDLGDGATLTLSKLTGIFGDEERFGTEKSLLKVGSVINELSQNCSASAPYLAEFSSRLGGIAAQSKMTISQVMAFAAVLDSNNLAVEASSTAVGQLITSIYQEPAKIAKAAGMDVAKFSKLVKTDMNGALIALFEQLNRFGGMESLAAVFDSMGTDGARAIPVLTALAGHVETLKWQQEQANAAFKEGTSVTNEFNVQNNTVQAQLDKARKGFTEMAVSLGEQLLPVMRYCISGTSMLMRVLSVLVSIIANNKAVILTLIATMVTYTTVAKASALATKAWSVATAAGNSIATAYKVSILALRIAYYELTDQTLKANAAQKLFAQTTKANPLGLLMSAAVAVIGTIITLTETFNDNRRAAQEAAKEYEDWKKSITNVDAASGEYSAKELTRLDLLYKAAIDESKSKDERKKAVQQLQNLYPDYFKNLNIESISVDNLTKDYLALRDSILAAARARAAADLIYENQKQILQLQGERDAASEDRKKASAKRDQIRARNKGKDNRASASASTLTGSIAMSAGGSTELYAHESTAEADKAVYSATARMNESTKKINELNRANQKLVREYSKSTAFQDQMGLNGDSRTPAAAGPAPVRGETDKERKEREKRAREAQSAETEAQRKAKEALKKDLDERKSLYLQEE
ncbi:MAG: phage tail tape measure protein, partial [Muribaculaceae bacterium]|nr:phage tail tape measure protein [Muribaculaceae bacterium]